jgi:rubrerythrin
MSAHGEGQQAGYERIKAKKTLREVLEVATSFEEAARDFYTALIPRVSKQIRYLVQELAEEEQQHYELFNGLADRPDLADYVKQEVRTPAEDHKFSNFVQLPDLGETPDDQSVLQYALAREDAAMKHYRDLAEQAEPGPLKDLFRYLANEETKHKQELEKTYYEIVHSGGV